MLVANLKGKSTTRGWSFLAGDSSLAVQNKADHYGSSTLKHNISCCKLLWASFVDSESNVRLWVQLHEHKNLH
ncbi:hypothetical protein Tco_0874337 [Tanacetum coccineum]|uniref:Uncharacterized protein n=1 Tax=Tanacetum coccineum TaxID=301880 RepID=A0ABQ5BPF5_9ASTR